jgi:opacity protein-like surface antigen
MRIGLTAIAVGLATIIAAPASAQSEPIEYFDGAYFGVTNLGVGGYGLFNIGYAAGRATYRFLIDGHYNSAAGQSFTIALPKNPLGAPVGAFFGRNWQYGTRVYGVEAYFHSTVVRADNFNSPDDIHTGNHSYDIKPHWLATLTAVAGVAYGRVMFYGQIGPALGHPVAEIVDLDQSLVIWTPRAVPGISVGAGLQFALTPSLAIGVGYRAYALAPLHVTGNSVDQGTGMPVPGTETDHTIQISAHSLTARIVYRFGQTERAQSRAAPFEWGGFYAGNYLSALWQIGGQVGYDWTFGSDMLAGVSFQAGVGICCGRSYDFALSARIGRVLGNNILGYAEATGAYQTGTFFGVVDGAYYAAGLGIEIALTPRLTAFMEAKAIGAPGLGFADAYVQGGFNIHIGRR